jgi:hypothetical protein
MMSLNLVKCIHNLLFSNIDSLPSFLGKKNLFFLLLVNTKTRQDLELEILTGKTVSINSFFGGSKLEIDSCQRFKGGKKFLTVNFFYSFRNDLKRFFKSQICLISELKSFRSICEN